MQKIEKIVNTLILGHKNLSDKTLSFCEEIVDRRGMAVVKVNSKEQSYALKFSLPEGVEVYDPFKIIKHEGEILKQAGEIADNLYVDQGELNGVTWLLTKWIDGQNLYQWAEPLRKEYSEKNIATFLKIFIEICRKIEKINSAGFIHGDLQPVHFFLTHNNVITLIDWALVKNINNNSCELDYKGGLVHYVSPEVAVQMLGKKDNILLDEISEVYSLATVLFTLYTGKTSTFYGSDNLKSISFEDKLKRVSEGNHNSFSKLNIPAFPNLEKLFCYALQVDRKKRCSSVKQFREELEQIYNK
ncbi:protein kinase [Candidatus Woesearchaeota archaeon]|jgi:serine/threonine protein kinase|nr:protein kinase [Candidatus Woesearchaeota archaeon]